MKSKLINLLNKCLNVNHSKQIHAHILLNALHNLDSLLLRQILLSAPKYSPSTTQYALLILRHSHYPNAFSWGCIIRFLSQHGQFKEAFSLYVQMQSLRLCPSTFAVSSALRACARLGNKMGGISLHGQVHKYGFCGCVYVQTALVDFYSKLRDIESAQKVFDAMAERNVVSWNSVLSGYLKCADIAVARRVFDEIPRRDVISWNSMISGYARAGDMEQACSLFQEMPDKNSASWNAIISGYVECGSLESARRFFDMMPQRNNISCITIIAGYSKCGDVDSAREIFDQIIEKYVLLFNAMIACYTQNSRAKEALQLFNQMLKPKINIQPDEMTLASVISASSQLGDISFGPWVESYMSKLGIVMDDHLATALIDLYAKCGNIDKAYELFHGLRKKDLVAYSAMISGCGINGKAIDAIKLFEAMVDAQIRPNIVTFAGLLTAYNHVGFIEEGYQCFNSMRDYGLVASADHYGIMVDLLGRAGRLKEAHELIESMPMQPHAGVWGALLLACSVHKNVELGEIAAQHCFELEPDTIGYYSLLANIYASAERWNDARRLRKVMEEKRLDKIPGCSWMEST